jgi:hypothetical protein
MELTHHMNENTAFVDLPPDSFPLTIELLDAETRLVRWSARVTEPGVLNVPSRTEVNDGKLLAARVTWPDGTVQEAGNE